LNSKGEPVGRTVKQTVKSLVKEFGENRRY